MTDPAIHRTYEQVGNREGSAHVNVMRPENLIEHKPLRSVFALAFSVCCGVWTSQVFAADDTNQFTLICHIESAAGKDRMSTGRHISTLTIDLKSKKWFRWEDQRLFDLARVSDSEIVLVEQVSANFLFKKRIYRHSGEYSMLSAGPVQASEDRGQLEANAPKQLTGRYQRRDFERPNRHEVK